MDGLSLLTEAFVTARVTMDHRVHVLPGSSVASGEPAALQAQALHIVDERDNM